MEEICFEPFEAVFTEECAMYLKFRVPQEECRAKLFAFIQRLNQENEGKYYFEFCDLKEGLLTIQFFPIAKESVLEVIEQNFPNCDKRQREIVIGLIDETLYKIQNKEVREKATDSMFHNFYLL